MHSKITLSCRGEENIIIILLKAFKPLYWNNELVLRALHMGVDTILELGGLS